MSSVRHLFCLAIVAILPLPGQTVPTITGRVRVTTSLTKKRISVPQVYERHAALAPPAAPANAAADMKEELRRVVIFIDTAGLRTQPSTPGSINGNEGLSLRSWWFRLDLPWIFPTWIRFFITSFHFRESSASTWATTVPDRAGRSRFRSRVWFRCIAICTRT